ncbi:MAG: CDP-glycerol glycerophosphotransferase family protein, partial [Propionicimonas sp.]|nr:CDP-glycerol glycerophosphotransferase family protein [Propionicimonas sp.]
NAAAVVEMLNKGTGKRLTFSFAVAASVAGTSVEELIVKTDFMRSSAAVHSCVVDEQALVDFSVRDDLPVVTVSRPAPSLVDAVSLAGRRVDVVLRHRTSDATWLKILHPGIDPVEVSIAPESGAFSFELPETRSEARTASRLKLKDAEGRWRSLAIDGASAIVQSSDGELVAVEGYLGQPFFFEGPQHVFVERVSVYETQLQVWLDISPGTASDLRVDLVGPKASVIRGKLVEAEGRRALFAFECELDSHLGWSRRMVVPGRYALQVETGAGVVPFRPRVQCSADLIKAVPLRGLGDGNLTVDLLRGGERSLILHLHAGAGDDYRPSSIRQSLIRRYRSSECRLSQQVYLQCLQGDQIGDSLLPIANELQAVNPQIEIVWGVLDLSIAVPTSHRRVVIGTPAHFEALSESALLFFNHEVPGYFEKRHGQAVVQTYHGHPFKTMGLARFRKAGYTQVEMARALRARAVWDYLLSPSPTATRLYRENFPLEYDVIEVGHPRNDGLASNDPAHRQTVRQRLGVPDGAKAVLYAPTWRDYAATSPWHSAMVDFIDPVELSDRLGPEYVVLLRGHPAHGRHSYEEVT